MGDFKPNSVFENSINSNDISAIKTCLENIISLDPLFKTTDFADACNYVRNKGVMIDEAYELLPGEIFSDKSEDWTRPYFFGLTEFLRRNFAVKERLPHIKEAGKVAFKDLQQQVRTAPPPSAGAPTPNFPKGSQNHHASRKSQGKLSLSTVVAALLALGAVVAVVVLIIRITRG